MSYSVYVKSYDSLVNPVMYYGAGTWGHEVRRKIQFVQNKAARYFLDAKKERFQYRNPWGPGMVYSTHKTKINSFKTLFSYTRCK